MIHIIPYKENWPEEFKFHAEKIKKAVGNRALAIHHIGSTSVPNLVAKDVIDIQMSVSNLSENIQPILLEIGFEISPHTQDHCPPGMQFQSADLEKRHYRGKERAINLHIRKQAAFNQRYAILFRDYLRSNTMAANAYGEIKRQLAFHFKDNVEGYYDVKDPVCDALIAGALEWAKVNKWQPGPSDV